MLFWCSFFRQSTSHTSWRNLDFLPAPGTPRKAIRPSCYLVAGFVGWLVDCSVGWWVIRSRHGGGIGEAPQKVTKQKCVRPLFFPFFGAIFGVPISHKWWPNVSLVRLWVPPKISGVGPRRPPSVKEQPTLLRRGFWELKMKPMTPQCTPSYKKNNNKTH